MTQNPVDSTSVNFENGRDGINIEIGMLSKPANGFPIQFCATVTFAMMGAISAALFLLSISCVINPIAQPKMGRIHTFTVISIRAIMQNAFSFRNRSEVQDPTRPMRQQHAPAPKPSGNLAVSLKQGTAPKPARASEFDSMEKAAWECFGKALRCKVIVSYGDWLHYSLPRWVSAREAF